MKLAIRGGTKTRIKLFPQQITVGKEEEEAAVNVIRTGRLSHFRGNWSDVFYGGPEIQALEKEWATKFNVKHAIAVNSATSGLIVACGAIGLAPQDEVIVTPWSMSCSATAPLWWNAIPVFADIEYDHYCLDPKSVEQRITERTRAIIVVDLFGQSYDVEPINKIAEQHNLIVIEDAAQAIGSTYLHPWESYFQKHYAGTLGDIGIYSLTHGKHLTSGEGGVIVTNDSNLAFRCRLIRNHAEAVINDMPGRGWSLLPDENDVVDVVPESKLAIDANMYSEKIQLSRWNYKGNMLGLNVRMTEIAAAIARCQLRKLNGFVEARQRNAKLLGNAIADIPAIRPSPVRDNCTHSYYVQAFKFDKKIAGIHRDKYIEAVKAELMPEEGRESEGVPIGCGYIQPLYLFPLFQRRKLYGGTNYPWPSIYSLTNSNYVKYRTNYAPGSCPVAERLWEDELWLWRLQSLPLTEKDIQDIAEAFGKVWKYREELKCT